MDISSFDDKKTFKALKKKVKPYKNTLVLDSFDVVLLLNIIYGDDDFYYKFLKSQDSRYYLSSCCGEFIPLKGKIGKEKYRRLVNMWNLNNDTKAK